MKTKPVASKFVLGIVLTLFGGILWGLSGICAQYLIQYEHASPDWLTPLRLMAAGALLVLFQMCRHRTRVFRVLTCQQDRFGLLLFAVFGMAGCQYTYYVSIQYSNAGTATILQYLGPSLVLLYVCVKDRVLPRPAALIGVVLSVFGTVLMATHGNTHSLVISGVALAAGLLSALGQAFYTLQPGRLILVHGAQTIAGWGALLGGIALAMLFHPWQHFVPLSARGWLAFAGMVVLGGMVAYCAFLQGVQLLGPTMGSLLACIEPLSALVFAAVLFHIRFTLPDVLGFVCILSTILLLTLDTPQREKASEPACRASTQ